ncbi:hypothetical protein P4493_04240 [Bacillus thuringiensis]|uniref:Uncharacterized protein n=5 Tax=Bacillus thuringiensis TaxID=1428 RepID=A0AB33AQR0_BACTU|nr:MULTISPECIES: hypothetical protein [Bacillus]MEC2535486.1 hypothetical protein [Bacillus cereus]MED1153800.1 hypothetical protein [Bacillus paranthracis]AFQ30112.1 hypothetical protein BTF1_30057 [Bacillus thuringiensis HD-789]AJG74083.1 hypothetical protein BF38_5914 [Bacillus thuringiensis]AJH03031.1 hypothetical protein AS86_6443 [Bacillus thuringiensis HD1002]
MTYFKNGFEVQHNKLKIRLSSIRSLLHNLNFQIADRGMIDTASIVSKQDVSAYLTDEYGVEELEVIKNYSDGFYEVDDYLMLEFGARVTTNEDLKKDLELLSNYFRVQTTENHLSKYLGKKQSVNSNTIVKPLATIEKGRIKFRGVNDLSYIENFYTVGNAKEIYVSGIFYQALSEYAGISNLSNWTFRKELSRHDESRYILKVLEGAIKPNTEKGKLVYEKYLDVITKRGENFIFMETYLKRAEELDYYTDRLLAEGKQLKGITDYSIIYEDNIEEVDTFPFYTSYYAIDYDNQCELDMVNRIRGVGGEFTREITEENKYDFPVTVYINGKKEKMYPVKENPIIKMHNLEKTGFAYSGDNEYVRALNASELQLDASILVTEATKYVNVYNKAMCKAVDEYNELLEDEDDMHLKVTPKVTKEDNKMYIANKLKYYSVNPNLERVVEGTLILNENLESPTLKMLISDDMFVDYSIEDLEKRRAFYVEEEKSMYAYKFTMQYDTESKDIITVRENLVGIVRKGKKVNPTVLTAMGLSLEQEELIRKMVRKEILNKVMECKDSSEYFKKVIESSSKEGEKQHA